MGGCSTNDTEGKHPPNAEGKTKKLLTEGKTKKLQHNANQRKTSKIQQDPNG